MRVARSRFSHTIIQRQVHRAGSISPIASIVPEKSDNIYIFNLPEVPYSPPKAAIYLMYLMSALTCLFYHSIIKVLAERTAWDLAASDDIDLVVVNPSYVWGPPQAREAGTFNLIRLKGILNGDDFWPFAFPVCDTRDIAAIQILAAENPQARGRYIVSSAETIDPATIAKIIQNNFPSSFKPGNYDPKIKPSRLFDNGKVLRELGYRLITPEETLVDTIKAIVKLGI